VIGSAPGAADRHQPPVPIPVCGLHSVQVSEGCAQFTGALFPQVLRGRHRPRQVVEPELGESAQDGVVGAVLAGPVNRWAPRDFLDVDTILASGRYTRRQLMSVVAEHNPGFSVEMFVESLTYLHRIPNREFAAYVASQQQIDRMRREFSSWEDDLDTRH
jgi:hypothetical protein